MRVVAGAAKGRRLTVPSGADVRPTSDRVKEALFASLQPELPGAAVLDLYAGSGALGLEALSRGAARITLIERDRRALEALRANVAAVGLPGATVVAAGVEQALRWPPPGGPFDLVLLDPPYRVDAASLERVLVATVVHVRAGGWVVVERDSRTDPPRWPEGLRPDPARRYGDTTLHRARRDPPDAAQEPPDTDAGAGERSSR